MSDLPTSKFVTKTKQFVIKHVVAKGTLLPIEEGDVFYYEFSQNNSGGRFKRDENVAEAVIIAACNAEEANSRAKDIGIYFHGCSKGKDCKCCGDRWSKISSWSKEGALEALVYDKSLRLIC